MSIYYTIYVLIIFKLCKPIMSVTILNFFFNYLCKIIIKPKLMYVFLNFLVRKLFNEYGPLETINRKLV